MKELEKLKNHLRKYLLKDGESIEYSIIVVLNPKIRLIDPYSAKDLEQAIRLVRFLKEKHPDKNILIFEREVKVNYNEISYEELEDKIKKQWSDDI
jgi:hypothetical protein